MDGFGEFEVGHLLGFNAYSDTEPGSKESVPSLPPESDIRRGTGERAKGFDAGWMKAWRGRREEIGEGTYGEGFVAGWLAYRAEKKKGSPDCEWPTAPRHHIFRGDEDEEARGFDAGWMKGFWAGRQGR